MNLDPPLAAAKPYFGPPRPPGMAVTDTGARAAVLSRFRSYKHAAADARRCLSIGSWKTEATAIVRKHAETDLHQQHDWRI